MDGTLPSLQLPAEGTRGEVLSAKEIPKWAAGMLGDEKEKDVFEGYRDEKAKEESRAWVSLVEGAVHPALVNACLLASSFYLKLITSLRSSTNPIPRSFHHSFLHRCLTRQTPGHSPRIYPHRPLQSQASPLFYRPTENASPAPPSFFSTKMPSRPSRNG